MQAIFAWGLFNEPRCPASQNGVGCTGRITNWGNEVRPYSCTFGLASCSRLRAYDTYDVTRGRRSIYHLTVLWEYSDLASDGWAVAPLQMFGYARSLSRKQLLTFGEEGFFAKGTQYQNCNPYGE